jgi:hypothetical protein
MHDRLSTKHGLVYSSGFDYQIIETLKIKRKVLHSIPVILYVYLSQ